MNNIKVNTPNMANVFWLTYTPDINAVDPAFWVGETKIVTIELNGEELHVGCFGDMRIQLPDMDYPIRDTSRLYKIGVTTDQELQDLERKYGNDIWQNNAWFEVWDQAGTYYDMVFYDLFEAVAWCKNKLGGSNE